MDLQPENQGYMLPLIHWVVSGHSWGGGIMIVKSTSWEAGDFSVRWSWVCILVLTFTVYRRKALEPLWCLVLPFTKQREYCQPQSVILRVNDREDAVYPVEYYKKLVGVIFWKGWHLNPLFLHCMKAFLCLLFPSTGTAAPLAPGPWWPARSTGCSHEARIENLILAVGLMQHQAHWHRALGPNQTTAGVCPSWLSAAVCPWVLPIFSSWVSSLHDDSVSCLLPKTKQ